MCAHSIVLKASVSTQVSSSTSDSRSSARAAAEAKIASPPDRTDSEIRRIARDEIERYARDSYKAERTDSEIRTISRDEIQRYKEAERKLDAHPEAYAHGRLVPVERRIEVERDIAESKPWLQSIQTEAKARPIPVSRAQSRVEDVQVRPKTKEVVRESQSNARSWGPKWRRDLSIERHSRAGVSDQEFQHTNALNLDQGDTQARGGQAPTNIKSRKIYSIAQESKTPRWSSEVEPQVAHVERTQPLGKQESSVVEVVDELDLPPGSRTASYRRHDQDGAPSVRGEKLEKIRGKTANEFEPSEKDRGSGWSQPSRHMNDNHWYGRVTEQTADTRPTQQNASSRSRRRQQRSDCPSSRWTEHTAKTSSRDRVSTHASKYSEKTSWPRENGPHKAAENAQDPVYGPQYSQEDITIVRPTDTPRGKGSKVERPDNNKFSGDPESEYIFTERTVQPAGRPRGSRPFDDHLPQERTVVEELVDARRRPAEQPPSKGARGEHQGYEKPEGRDNDGSNRVRFNSKVDISPTPPGSDASSSAFRSFHSIGRGSSRQIDGHEDLEQGEDSSAEYEQRGRTRSRAPRTKSAYKWEVLYEEDQRDSTVKPKGRPDQPDKFVKPNAWVSGERLLERALSESPSRENLSELRQSDTNSRGPYCVSDKVTEGITVQEGRPNAGFGNGGGSAHGSIGQAAQIR